MIETVTIDRLFLELSQITKAKTSNEICLENELKAWKKFAAYCRSCALSGESNPQDFKTFVEYSNLSLCLDKLSTAHSGL